jgi:hypothetical protein
MADQVPTFSWITQIQASMNQPSTVTIQAEPSFTANVTKQMLPYQQLSTAVQPALEDIATYLRDKVIPGIFKSEGPGWASLSKRTQIERQKAGFNPTHPILRRSGDLFAELTSKSHPKHVETIQVSPGKYTLTIGGSSEKFVNNQLGRGDLNLPQRSMLPGVGGMTLNPADAIKIQDLFTTRVEQQLKAQSG